MKIGRKIYHDKITGDVIVDTGERQGSVRPSNIEQDIATYTALSERNRDTFDVIELEFGQYAQDFAECNGYRVNLETKQIEFSYPDPNETEPIEPVYQTPLSEEVDLLKKKLKSTEGNVEMLEGALFELTMLVL